MIYSLDQLRSIIRPIIATAVRMDEDNNTKIDVTTNAIIELICQDRVSQITEKGTSD